MRINKKVAKGKCLDLFLQILLLNLKEMYGD